MGEMNKLVTFSRTVIVENCEGLSQEEIIQKSVILANEENYFTEEDIISIDDKEYIHENRFNKKLENYIKIVAASNFKNKSSRKIEINNNKFTEKLPNELKIDGKDLLKKKDSQKKSGE